MRTSLLLLLLTASCTASAQTVQTLRFSEDPSPTSNPERGFYDVCDPMAGTTPGPIDLAACGNAGPSGATLIFRYVDLGAFVDRPISAAYLQRMSDDLAAVRAAGLKIVLRVAYEIDPEVDLVTDDYEPPYGDATKARVLSHIDQLAPVLAENADVLLALQAGFIGLWGEWYYTDHFVADPSNPGVITDADFDDRRDVVDALLGVLPPSRSVQIRVPYHKAEMLETAEPLSDEEAHDGSPRARVGYHNDCFLADPYDVGTYRYGNVEDDRAYLAAETRNLVMGGETCDPQSGAGSPRFGCAEAVADMETFHWTYLNRDYYTPALDRWRGEGCYDEIESRLGYRLVLEEGSAPAEVRPGGRFPFSLDLRNEGFAALVNPRPVGLVLRNLTTGAERAVTLPEDPRRWYPGEVRLSYDLGVGADTPPGEYGLYLALPDAAPTLADRPEYAVRTSNEGTWESELGMNRLATVVVSESAPGPAHNGGLLFGDHAVSTDPLASEGFSATVAPNPVRSSATLTVRLEVPAHVEISIYDTLGREVSALGTSLGDGTSQVPLDLSALPAGVYIVRVATAAGQTVRRVTVVR